MTPLADCRLYTFVDTACLRGRPAGEVARQLCAGGADVIQLRAKNLPQNEVAKLAEEIAPIAENSGVHFVVNDYLDVARRMPRAFVHLGQEDFFDAGFTHVSQLGAKFPASAGLSVRAAADSRRQDADAPGVESAPDGEPVRPWLVGLSTHAPAQAARAVAAGANYIAIGPVFATPTKPGRAAVTLEYVRWAAATVRVPWFAIGGITLQNLNDVLDAGARRICVVSAILNAPNVARACQQFKLRLASASLGN